MDINLKILIEKGLAIQPPEGVIMPTYDKLVESSLNTNWTPPSLELLQSVQNEVDELEYKWAIINKVKEMALQRLIGTDYKAVKYAEGLISDSEYEIIKTERQKYRDLINNAENMTIQELEAYD